MMIRLWWFGISDSKPHVRNTTDGTKSQKIKKIKNNKKNKIKIKIKSQK